MNLKWTHRQTSVRSRQKKTGTLAIKSGSSEALAIKDPIVAREGGEKWKPMTDVVLMKEAQVECLKEKKLFKDTTAKLKADHEKAFESDNGEVGDRVT
ncbi:unnamed protein product [Prunus armeniaca]|uniref:Uncharacterized protein n=1 Tax=Prunus armeniaca TaxID=36596 RepID=A0A6J5TUR0_PRUAR|nr:unnamed protein product [Prunus armeniaca]CAB4297955.1 unnamed protein product [Prunus armeniaca]